MNPKDLFGTDEPVPERRLLSAGPLSAILEDGNLRSIRFAGIEAVRAVNYLARDTSWGTYKAALSECSIEESDGLFEISYRGLCAGEEGRFAYRMHIRGEASGRLTLEAEGEALTDFPTNRTGFVVLHPAETAGGRLTIGHSDGSIEETVFPQAISPDQPAFDIAALTHEPAPGLTCRVEMEGDAFEMEDQRNWSDASFKTYIRPLSKPRPYLIAKGGRDRQRVSIVIEGKASAAAPAQGSVEAASGPTDGRMPSLALFLDAEEPLESPAPLPRGIAQDLIVWLGPAGGDGADRLRRAARRADLLGAGLAVEAVFEARDPATEARAVAGAVAEAGVAPSAILVAPRREFKTRPSGSLPPGECGTGPLVAALRAAGVGVPIGAGTPSNFTEFNRNPPDPDCDFVFFGVFATTHAADDISVMETLSVYPALIESARRLCPGRPIWLGPCTIGARHNAYGAAVAPNPHGGRVPSARFDPRQGALFGAAFAVGVAAEAAVCGVDRLILAAPIGPFGLLDRAGRPTPLLAVHAELAAAAGAERMAFPSVQPGLAAVAFRRDGAPRALVANLTPDDMVIRLPGMFRTVSLVERDGSLGALPVADGEAALGPYRTAVISG